MNLRRMFVGYWAVLNHRVGGRITAIRYALFNAFSAGVLMCFITNASMIFINHFSFSPQQFGFAFASLGLSMIAGNRLSIRMANRLPAETWLRYATVVQLICLSALVALSLSGAATPLVVGGLILLVICMTGSIMPTASGRYITFFDEHAGSAASLATTLVFALGAGIGALAAILAQGSITPVFITMASSCAIGLIILNTIHTRH
ncbi:MAG: DHA1 family bicyclomycin/chloramphenicol resistance-like MFS transporter [Dinoroseobacter sp.]